MEFRIEIAHYVRERIVAVVEAESEDALAEGFPDIYDVACDSTGWKIGDCEADDDETFHVLRDCGEEPDLRLKLTPSGVEDVEHINRERTATRLLIREILALNSGRSMDAEEDRDALEDALVEALAGVHTMDAPEGPMCRCGKPARHESGWCGECDCNHDSVKVDFDEVAAEKLDNPGVVRKLWPRFYGVCPDCNRQIIKYASHAHFVLGDW